MSTSQIVAGILLAAVLGLLCVSVNATLGARARLRERVEAERRLTCILALAESQPTITVAAAQFTCTPYRP